MMKCHERKIISKLLEMAAQQFSYHGCNDLPKDFFDGMTEDDVKVLHDDIRAFRGEKDEYFLFDCCLMEYFAEYINNIEENDVNIKT